MTSGAATPDAANPGFGCPETDDASPQFKRFVGAFVNHGLGCPVLLATNPGLGLS